MKIKTKTVIFAVAVIFQLAVLSAIVTRSVRIKDYAQKHGTIMVFKCSAYDPYHPFKGRYVKLTILDKTYPDAKKYDEYYLQESYADIVDAINWRDFNDMDPELELYVDDKGRAVQKTLTVLIDGNRMSIEDYCRSKK